MSFLERLCYAIALPSLFIAGYFVGHWQPRPALQPMESILTIDGQRVHMACASALRTGPYACTVTTLGAEAPVNATPVAHGPYYVDLNIQSPASLPHVALALVDKQSCHKEHAP